MKKSLLFFMSLLLSGFSFAQLTGIKTIPGDYATIASAITALNSSGVGAGGVSFNVAAGYTEMITAPLSITATGTLANPIIFQKNGAGANPLITAYNGTATAASAVQDGIWNLVGSDYVTIDGISLVDSNPNNPATMEYGYAMFKASASNGCQYNTIKNCVVTLNRNNIALGTAPSVDGSRAINITNSLVTTQATILVPSNSLGTNSYNKLYSNTLQNCNIGIAIIGYAGVSPFATCDFGNDIGGTSLATGNSLLNFGGGAGATTANAAAGVRTLAQYDLNVSYNTVNNNNGSGINHTGPMRGIYVYLAITASENISNNVLSITSGATSSATSCIEIGSGGTSVSNTININNNTMTGGSTTLTTGNYYGIWNSLVTGTVNINSNTISGISTTGTGTIYGMVAGLPVSFVINNNTITNLTKTGNGRITAMITNAHIICQNNLIDGLTCTAANSTSAIYGIMDNVQTATTGESYISNTIRNLSSTGTAVIYGIFTAAVINATGNKTIQNNLLYNFTIAGNGTIYGISKNYGGTDTISGNQIHDLSITGSNSGTIYGLRSAGATTNYVYDNNMYALSCAGGNAGSVVGINIETGTTNNIYRNKCYNLSSASTNPSLYGVYIASGITNNFFNNFISDLRTPAANSGLIQLAGIYILGGTTNNIFYNSVYLNGTSIGAPFGSAALYTLTDSWLLMKNNILVNATTPTGAGIAAAYYRGGMSLTHFDVNSNNNDYYAGTPSASNLIFYDGINSDQTLNAYKIRVAPIEATSVTELPPFVNVASAPYDLHLQTTIATFCESGGSAITSPAVTSDYDNDIRYPYSGYPNNPLSPASASDIGADEFAGLFMDVTPPTIFYTPFLNTSSTTSRTLTATITDISGVPTTGNGRPVMYWKINSGPWTSATGTWISGNSYTFTFGGGVVLTDVVSYYIVAQDIVSPTPNTGSNPSAGSAGFTASPPACSTPPTRPYTYTIIGSICGTFTVGSGQAYSTLTAALNDLSNKEMICPVTFLLTDATYTSSETFPLTIVSNPGSSLVNKLTIKTATGINATITGSVPNGALINVLNSNTIIDGANAAGGSSRNLTIYNTSTIVPNVVLIGVTGTDPIVNATLKNCILKNGINSATAVSISNAVLPGTPGYFNNITIQNNSVQLAYLGICCMAVNTPGNGNGLLITGNDMTTPGANAIRLTGIYVEGVDGVTISNNSIGNIANTTEADNLNAIFVAAGTVNATISGNTITSIVGTIAGPTGIAIASACVNANINVSDNIISGLTTAAPTEVYGIRVYGAVSGCIIQKNMIFDIKNTHPAGYSPTGIALASTLPAANTTLKNNVIYDVAGYGFINWQRDNGYGINILSGGGYNLYFNTVHISTNQTLSGGVPLCLMISSAVTTLNCLDIRNNIFAIDATVGDMFLAVMCNAYKTVFSHMDYNVYFSTDQYFGDFVLIGNSHRLCSTLAEFQAQSGQDLHSANINPDFVSLTYQLPTTTAIPHAGINFPEIPLDYAGVNRTNPPDIGAYEFSVNPIVVTTSATSILSDNAILNGSINAANNTLGCFFDYGLTNAYGTSVPSIPVSINGNTVTPINFPITGLTPLTTYHFRARGVTLSGLIVYGNDITFTSTPNPPAVITTAATQITSNSAMLNGTVNSNNGTSTVTFEYGPTTAYGSTVTSLQSPVAGSTAVNVNASITGLLPNTICHFRAKGTNAGGTTYGNDMSFITNPVLASVITDLASSVAATAVQANGSVNPNYAVSTVSFQWGLTNAYGNTAAAIPGSVTGSTPTSVLASLTGLAINTLYHFRCVGINSAGTAYGLDQTFTTNCVAPVITINGPAATCSGVTGYIYSTQTGNTSYTWNISAGGIITAGNGTNSITVKWNTTGTQSVSVNYNNQSGCSASVPAAFNVIVSSTPSPTISGPAMAGTNYPGYAYSTETGMNNYIWTISPGGTITSGLGTNIISVTWNSAGAQSVSVTYTNSNGCAAFSPAIQNTNVYAAPVISGTNVVCQTTAYQDYTTEPGMTNYVWNMSPNSGTITQSSTNVVTIFWTSPGAKWVSVSYANANGFTNPSPSVYNVTVNPLPGTPGIINGPQTICAGAVNIAFSVASVPNANTYNWTLPAGASIASGSGTNAIAVNFGLAASPGNISVIAQNACGDGPGSPALTIAVNTIPSVAGSIAGIESLCQGTTGMIYTVPAIANATSYSWTVPAGASIVTGSATNAITVNFSLSATSGIISVNGVNDCGSGAASPNFGVVVNPIPATPVITQHFDTLTSSANTGNQWYLNGVAIEGATGKKHIAVYAGNYTVVVTLTGCSSATSNSILVLPVSLSGIEVSQSFEVYPNPNYGQFNIKVVSGKQVELNIEIYNNLGALLWKQENVRIDGTYTTPVALNSAPAGVYMVALRNRDIDIVRKVVILK